MKHLLSTISLVLLFILAVSSIAQVATNTTNSTSTNTTRAPNTTTTTVTTPAPRIINTTLRSLDFMLIPPLQQSSVSASWIRAILKFTWDSIFENSNFCPRDNQCLVSAAGDPNLNDQPDQYFLSASDGGRPQCLTSGQYVLDHYCVNGAWSSRTYQIFLTLLNLAQSTSSSNYSLVCGPATKVFNHVNYAVAGNVLASTLLGQTCNPSGSAQSYGCVNNACVLQYTGGTAFGISLNEPLGGGNSFLKVLNQSTTLCDSALGSGAQGFAPCTTSAPHISYSPSLHALIYVQNEALPSVNTAQTESTFVTPLYQTILNYQRTINDTTFQKQYLDRPQSFSSIALTKRGNKQIFGFVENDKTQFHYDYTIARYTNIDLGQNPCTNLVKPIDDKAYCETQPDGTSFTVIAQSTGERNLAKVWLDLVAKINP